MTSINATQARTDLFKVIALVNETSIPVTLMNNDGKMPFLSVKMIGVLFKNHFI